MSSLLAAEIRQIVWNPGFTGIIAVLLTDGQIVLVTLTGTVASVSSSLQSTATAGKH